MFPVGVVLLSLGYAVAYYGTAVLRWVHDPAHPHVGPPSLMFLLGASSTPTGGKAFSAPVNTEGATDAFAPFGAAAAASASGGGSGTGNNSASGPPGSGPSVLTPQGELGAIIGGLGG